MGDLSDFIGRMRDVLQVIDGLENLDSSEKSELVGLVSARAVEYFFDSSLGIVSRAGRSYSGNYGNGGYMQKI